jgi:hypothetical protein
VGGKERFDTAITVLVRSRRQEGSAVKATASFTPIVMTIALY